MQPTSPAARTEPSPRRRSRNGTTTPDTVQQPASTGADAAVEVWQAGEDAVARRAYELYCARGCEHGHDMEDWLQAEREVRAATIR